MLLLVLAACGGSADGSGEGIATTSTIALEPAAQEFVDHVRELETLVVGDVFTEYMFDADLADLGLALCELEAAAPGSALPQLEGVLDRYDWIMPANRAIGEDVIDVTEVGLCDSGLASTGLPIDALVAPRPQSPVTETETPPDASTTSVGQRSPATGGSVDDALSAFLETPDGESFIGSIRDAEAELSPVFTESMLDVELARLARGFCSTSAELGGDAPDELRLHQETYGWTGPSDDAMFHLIVELSDLVCITVGS